MKSIVDKYQFNGKNYPGFDALAPDEQFLFSVEHSILHMNKSLGKLAAEAEAADHGEAMNVINLHTATVKMIVNSLRLAEILKLTPENVVEMIPIVMKSQ